MQLSEQQTNISERVIAGMCSPDPLSLIVDATAGSGKALAATELVPTPTGWAVMETLREGSLVYGLDGKPATVVGVYPQGLQSTYKVTFSDGSSVRCTNDHLWAVWNDIQRSNKSHYKVLPLSALIDHVRARPGQLGERWNFSIPIAGAIELQEQAIPLDPYTLGYLLGNGGLSQKSVRVSIPDPSTIISLLHFPTPCQLNKVSGDNIDYSVSGDGNNTTLLALRQLGLMGCTSVTKFIPECYKWNSIAVRIEVLRGLLDADGTVTHTGHSTEYATSSEKLKNDVVFLINSLGGTASVRQKLPKFTYKGERRTGQLSYTVTMRFFGDPTLFKLERKQRKIVPKSEYAPTRYIVDISPAGEEECICIKVDREDGLFLTNHFIVTHNTTTAAHVMHQVQERCTGFAPPKIIYMAFGKRNERDMLRKVQDFSWPHGLPTITTRHANGRRMRSMRTDFNRGRRILEGLDNRVGGKPWHFALTRLTEVAQQHGVMVPDEFGKVFWPSPNEWEKMAYDSDVDTTMPLRRKTTDTWRMIDRWLKEILTAHAKFDGTCTYGDMVWLPCVHPEMRAEFPKYDLVIVDEYQDTNVTGRIHSNLLVKPEGVRLWIGDRRQSILGFAGADYQAFNSIERSQQCPVEHFPLSVSFRVTKATQKEVVKIAPEFAVWEGAAEGEPAKRISLEKAMSLLQPGDVILARNNKPLIDVFFTLLNSGVQARLEGDDFGKKLQASQERFLKRTGMSSLSIAEFRIAVASEGARQFTEYLNEGRKWKAAKVRDEFTAWLRVIDFAIRTPEELMKNIFKPGPFAKPHDFTKRTIATVDLVITYILKVSAADSDEARETMITCSTGHKSKGLEFNNVFWYGYDTLHPSKYATTPEEITQEENLVFVIRTRSCGLMYLIPEIAGDEEPGFEDEEDKLSPPEESDYEDSPEQIEKRLSHGARYGDSPSLTTGPGGHEVVTSTVPGGLGADKEPWN